MNDKNDKAIKRAFIVITLIVFIPYCLVAYLAFPFNEKISCNSNYECEVTTTRYMNIKSVEKFNITKDSNINVNYIFKYPDYSNDKPELAIMMGHLYYIKIDNTQYFQYPVCMVSEFKNNHKGIKKLFVDSININTYKYLRGFSNKTNKIDREYNYEEICKPYIDNIIYNFDQYKQGHKINFIVESAANKSDFWFAFLFGFAGWSFINILLLSQTSHCKKLIQPKNTRKRVKNKKR